MLPKSDGSGWPSLREIEAASVGGLFHCLGLNALVASEHFFERFHPFGIDSSGNLGAGLFPTLLA
jgi:hypothetical protein